MLALRDAVECMRPSQALIFGILSEIPSSSFRRIGIAVGWRCGTITLRVRLRLELC